MSRKAWIAHLAGPNATIQNTPPLITSNKARVKHGLPLLRNPDGTPARFDVLRPQRLAAPVTVYVEQFSAHPLEADVAELYGPPDGWLNIDGHVRKERQDPGDKPVYAVELRPEDGVYPLPYMARQVDGAAWEEECAFAGAPEAQARQGFFPDGARSFEEIDRLQIGEAGTGNLIAAKADIDFYRILPPSGYTKGLPADQRTDTGAGDIPPEQRGTDFFPYKPSHLAASRRVRASHARPMPCSGSWRAANTTAQSGPRAARGSRRRSTGSICSSTRPCRSAAMPLSGRTA